MGTPVIAHRFGLLGHLVRVYGLGLSIDCANPRTLRTALLMMADPARCATYAEALAAFSARFAPDRFRAALLSGLGLGRDELPEAESDASSVLIGDPRGRQ